jgi:4-amino-4-deoxy-L-arabinose transferase-like glycosyltransferase
MQASEPQYSWYWAIIVSLLLIAFAYSAYRLTESPPTWFDEGIYIQVAQSLAERGTQAIQIAPGEYEGTGHVTGGYPFLAPVALSIKIFGPSLFAARLPMVLFILLYITAAWTLLYKLFGPREAFWGTLLLAVFPLLYGNGKNVLGEVPGMFYTLSALYCLWQIEAHGYIGRKWYILAGLFVGLAVATKPIFFLLPLAIGVVFLLRIRTIPLHWKEIGLATLAMAMPLLLWIYLQFGAESVATIFSHYLNPYAETDLLALVLQNFFRFFGEATPLFAAGLFGIWMLALAVRLYRKASPSNAELVAFVFSLFILLAYLRTAGWYRYFFEAMVLSLIFLPPALRTLASSIRQPWLAPAVLSILAAFMFYQLNFSSWVADHYASTQTAEFEQYFGSHDLQNVLVFNAPEVVPFLKTEEYYQYFDIEPTGALAYGKENLERLMQGVPSKVLVSPSEFMKHLNFFVRYKQSDMVGGLLLLSRQ